MSWIQKNDEMKVVDMHPSKGKLIFRLILLDSRNFHLTFNSEFHYHLGSHAGIYLDGGGKAQMVSKPEIRFP